MTHNHRTHLTLVVATLTAAVLACGPASTPAPSAADRATGLARTAEYVLTSTAAATITPATPTPLPTTTPEATATLEPSPTATVTVVVASPTPAVSPTPCENDSAFVADVNVPDGTHFAQGAAFNKTWRLRNDGFCTWTTAYTLRHVSGEGMGGATITLPNVVPAGATVDLTVALTAPARNGTFTGQWQLHGPDGAPFGTKPFVQIVVP